MKGKRPRRANTINLKIGGEGVSPSTVPVRALAEFLQAAAAAIEAVAHEAAKARAKKSSPQVRHAIKRLHGEAAKIGSLKLRVVPRDGGRARREITVAAPVEERGGIETFTEIYGRIVGIYVSRPPWLTVLLRLEEGRTEQFTVDGALVAAVTGLFNRCVRARVTYLDDGEELEPLMIEAIEAWDRSGADFIEAAESLRSDLQSEGIEIDASAWLKEIHGDD